MMRNRIRGEYVCDVCGTEIKKLDGQPPLDFDSTIPFRDFCPECKKALIALILEKRNQNGGS